MAEAPPPPGNDHDPDNMPPPTPPRSPPRSPPPDYLPSYEEWTGSTVPEVVRTFIESRTLPYHRAWDCSPQHYTSLCNLIGRIIDSFDDFERYVERRTADGGPDIRHDVAFERARRLASLVARLRREIMATATSSGVMSEARRTFLGRVMDHMEAMLPDNEAYARLSLDFGYRLKVWTLIYTLVELMPMDDKIEVPQRMLNFIDGFGNQPPPPYRAREWRSPWFPYPPPERDTSRDEYNSYVSDTVDRRDLYYSSLGLERLPRTLPAVTGPGGTPMRIGSEVRLLERTPLGWPGRSGEVMQIYPTGEVVVEYTYGQTEVVLMDHLECIRY